MSHDKSWISWAASVLLLVATQGVVKSSAKCVNDTRFDNVTSKSLKLWLHMAYLCEAAYAPATTLRDWTCGVCRQSLKSFEREVTITNGPFDTQALVGFDPTLGKSGALVVSMRGTANVENWIEDLTYQLTVPTIFGRRFQNKSNASIAVVAGMVHHGFLLAYHSVRPQILAAIKSIRGINSAMAAAPIYVTGHSLGGAMASLCVLDLQIEFEAEKSPPQLSMVNFGSPRVGTPQWVKFYASRVCRSLRVIHAHDIVPKVPFKRMGFAHDPRHYIDPSHYVNPIKCHIHYMGIPISHRSGPESQRFRAPQTLMASAPHRIRPTGDAAEISPDVATVVDGPWKRAESGRTRPSSVH